MADTSRPFTTFNFSIEIKVDGLPDTICDASFSECDGLEMTIEPKTIREGGRNSGPIHMAGAVSYGQLTLKRGMTTNGDLWSWFERVATPEFAGTRASAHVVMLASDRSTEQAKFLLTGCLPVKLKAPALNAKDGLVGIEEMQIAYESLSVERPAAAGQGEA